MTKFGQKGKIWALGPGKGKILESLGLDHSHGIGMIIHSPLTCAISQSEDFILKLLDKGY